jgi:hypothetical protein
VCALLWTVCRSRYSIRTLLTQLHGGEQAQRDAASAFIAMDSAALVSPPRPAPPKSAVAFEKRW